MDHLLDLYLSFVFIEFLHDQLDLSVLFCLVELLGLLIIGNTFLQRILQLQIPIILLNQFGICLCELSYLVFF